VCVDNCGGSCLDPDYLSWEWPGIGRSLIFLAAQGFVCLFIIYILESDILRRAVRPFKERRRIDNTQHGQQDVEMMTVDHGVSAASVEDSDVAAERQRITNTPVEQLASTDAVVLNQLSKFFNGNFLAVDRLSVGIPKGERQVQLQREQKTGTLTIVNK